MYGNPISFILIGFLVAGVLILMSDGDLSLMFHDKFGRKKLGKINFEMNTVQP